MLAPTLEHRNGNRVFAEPAVMRILMVGAQGLLKDALEALLNQQPDMIVVASVERIDRGDAMTMAYAPDIVIVGFGSSMRAVRETAAAVRDSGYAGPMILLSSSPSDAMLLAAVEAEASAVICAWDSAAALFDAIHRAPDGATLISPAAVSDILGKRRLDASGRKLTQRQKDVLTMLGEGANSRVIAGRLGISYLTVRTHIRNLTARFAVHSKLELVARARQMDLLEDPLRPAYRTLTTLS